LIKRRDFLTFMSSFDLSSKKLYKLFNEFNEDYFTFDMVKSKDFVEILGKDVDKIIENANESYLEKYSNSLIEKNIKLLTCEDKLFPEKLKNIDEPPFFLFYRGDLGLLDMKSVAIIGTRMPTTYGKSVTEKFAGDLAEAGVCIISGLAYGIDSIAHRKALEVGGKTIAVLGGGFDKIYPSEHTDLAREIAEKGLLITEYSPKYIASKFTFPQRNRIVAGLSDGVLITEAGAKSGTIITKDFALDNGITIYAVPGNITSSKSEVTNEIIAHSQGLCVLSARDILEDLGLDIKAKKKVVQLKLEEQMIVDLLADGEKNVDEIAEKTKISVNLLNSLLVNLEIRGIIGKGAGGEYSLT